MLSRTSLSRFSHNSAQTIRVAALKDHINVSVFVQLSDCNTNNIRALPNPYQPQPQPQPQRYSLGQPQETRVQTHGDMTVAGR